MVGNFICRFELVLVLLREVSDYVLLEAFLNDLKVETKVKIKLLGLRNLEEAMECTKKIEEKIGLWILNLAHDPPSTIQGPTH